jgi:hypothetical protein
MNPIGLKLRSRLRLALATVVLGTAAILGWTYFLQEQAVASTPLREFGVASMAQRIRDARGHVLVMVLYNPDSDDAYLVGDFRRWAIQVTPRVELFALAVGKRRDAQHLFRYGQEQGVQRIAPDWLAPSDPAVIDSAMAGLGIRGTHPWAAPRVTVIDAKGKVTAQVQGELNYEQLLAAAKAARPQLAAAGGLRK